MPTALRIIPRYSDDMNIQAKARRPEPRRSYGSEPMLQSLVRYAEEARKRHGEPFSFEAAVAQLTLDLREGRKRTMTDYEKLFGWSRQQLRDRRNDLQVVTAKLTKTPIENQTGTKQEPNGNQASRKKTQKTPIENQTGTKQEPNGNQSEGEGKKERFPYNPSKERINTSPLTPQAGGTGSGEGMTEGQEDQQTVGGVVGEAGLSGQSGKDTSEGSNPSQAQSTAATVAEILTELQFPEHLRCESVRAAFGEWIENRQGFRKPKRGWVKFFQSQINTILAPLTPEAAAASLTHCAANGYQGLFARQQQTTAQQASTTNNSGNLFWYVMPYHAALADATKNRYDGLPTHWIQFTGPDNKPYFVKPEHATRPMPEGFVRKEGGV